MEATADDAHEPPPIFVGWHRTRGGRWQRVSQAPTRREALWAALQHDQRAAHVEVVVLEEGVEP